MSKRALMCFLGSKDFLLAYFQCISVQLCSGRLMPFNISSGDTDLWVTWGSFLSNVVLQVKVAGMAWPGQVNSCLRSPLTDYFLDNGMIDVEYLAIF